MFLIPLFITPKYTFPLFGISNLSSEFLILDSSFFNWLFPIQVPSFIFQIQVSYFISNSTYLFLVPVLSSFLISVLFRYTDSDYPFSIFKLFSHSLVHTHDSSLLVLPNSRSLLVIHISTPFFFFLLKVPYFQILIKFMLLICHSYFKFLIQVPYFLLLPHVPYFCISN